jgi:hypothetical protein
LRDELIDQDLAAGAGVADGHVGSLKASVIKAWAMRLTASRKCCSKLA